MIDVDNNEIVEELDRQATERRQRRRRRCRLLTVELCHKCMERLRG